MKFWKHKDIWFTLLIGSIIIAMSWCAARTARSDESPLRSQTDVQEYLVSEGYDIGPKGVDGKIGKDTRTAWDKYIMETRYAQDNSDSTE